MMLLMLLLLMLLLLMLLMVMATEQQKKTLQVRGQSMREIACSATESQLLQPAAEASTCRQIIMRV
jgi:hypothetical protein